MFKKILIANRGEIAVRIIRACREMDIMSVASVLKQIKMHSMPSWQTRRSVSDQHLPKTVILTWNVYLGCNGSRSGCNSSGFGFLSENSKFVRMCEKCNITFIGPSAEIIDRMGNKSAARKTMMDAGVPVVPGTKDAVYEAEAGQKIADDMGYPVMIKASAGGGGKGMRVCYDSEASYILLRQRSRGRECIWRWNDVY